MLGTSHFIFFNFLIILAYKTSSISGNSSCSHPACGNGPIITSPFWVPRVQESRCGSPAFRVSCVDDEPVIKISGENFIILDVFHVNRSFLLAKSEVYDNENECPVPRRNFSTQGTPFAYGPDTADLFFFYNCSWLYEREKYALDCASDYSHHAFAVFHPQLLSRWNFFESSCQAPVTAPVEIDDQDRLANMNYTDVLKRGFVLQ